jgi:thiol-disulfide isomerase/thioredoxin
MNRIVTMLLAASLAAAANAAGTLPQLKLQTLDGKSFDLAQELGHWVVLNYWATWCAPCRKEMPDLSAFQAARKDVRVLGLAFEETEADDIKAFLKEHPVSYPVARLDVDNPPKDFDTPRGLPMTYLIAPDGKVAKKFLGPVTSADLGVFIREAAKLQPKPSA